MELVKPLLYFGFLFAVVVFLAWLTTRLVGTRMTGPTRGRPLRVLQHVPVGRERSILLLEVGGRIYMLGATAQQVTLLDAIDDPAAIQRIMAGLPPEGENPLGKILPQSFSDVLNQALGGFGSAGRAPNKPGQPAEADETERLQEQIERLKRLTKQE